MTLVLLDNARETTSTTGTGTLALLGAVTDYQSLAGVGDGNTTYYGIKGRGTGEWETGIGTYHSSGTTLDRTTVYSSSAGGTTKVNFSAGIKDVVCTQPAATALWPDTGSFNKVSVSAANNTAAGSGQIYLNGATGNRIDFANNGYGDPTYTTRSVGTKLLLWSSLDASNTDYAIGIGTDSLWSGIRNSGYNFRWFAGNSNIATLSGSGVLETSGSVVARLLYNNMQLMSVYGVGSAWYGAGIRNDGASGSLAQTVVSTTAAGVTTAALSSYRPLSWNLSTGAVSINQSDSGATYVGGASIALNAETGIGGSLEVTGDITITRSSAPNSGLLYLGNSHTRYLYSNGTSYIMPGANLVLNGVTVSSDERLKTDIKTIDGALKKVLSMRGCSYTLQGKPMAGVVAQELLGVMPTAVTKEDGETSLDPNGQEQINYYSVDYNQIIALLIESTKDQQKQINELKEQVLKLASNINGG